MGRRHTGGNVLARDERVSSGAMRAAWRLLFVVLGAFAAALLLGCSPPHLAGTNDAALEYAIDPDPATGMRAVSASAALTAAGVKARLAAAQLAADVSATAAGHVRVVSDAEAAGVIDALVLWRGGLVAYRVGDPARTPLVQLGVGPDAITAIEPVAHGKALALSLSSDAIGALDRARAAHPGARVALARGGAVLETMPIEDLRASPLVLRFGDDLVAYTRAYENELLLRSPVLPPMHRVSATRLPPRWGLAAACALLPFALSFAWLFFVRRFDRARPEPTWLLVATFALGGLAIVPAALLEIGASKLSPWLDPSLVTMGGQLRALPIAVVVFSLVVGAVEEGAKLLGAWALARHRREFDEPVDGIVYGCAAALGFAAVENVKYFAVGRMSGAVIAIRAFMTVPAHMFFGALWGYALGRGLVSRRAGVLGFFALAAVAHGAFDAMLSTNGTQLAATLLVLVLGFGFVVLLQRALRHGAVPVGARRGHDPEEPPQTEPVPASMLPRTYFRVGSRAAFSACAAAMIACAFSLTVLGTAYELLHHRVGVVFVGLATSMLVLFGLAAYGASATIPLDVAVDAQGVTFAGARTPWRAILGFDRVQAGARAVVRLHTPAGVVRLGPARAATADALLAALRAATLMSQS